MKKWFLDDDWNQSWMPIMTPIGTQYMTIIVQFIEYYWYKEALTCTHFGYGWESAEFKRNSFKRREILLLYLLEICDILLWDRYWNDCTANKSIDHFPMIIVQEISHAIPDYQYTISTEQLGKLLDYYMLF